MPKPKPSKPSKTSSSTSQPPQPSQIATPPPGPTSNPLPVTDLTPSLHPSTSKIALIPSFFPRSLCRDYVTFLKSLPLQTTPTRPKRGEAVRVNDRYQIDDPVFAKRLWEMTGLKNALSGDEVRDLWGGEPVGLSPNIRVYRYSKGQYFDCHYDDSNNLILDSTPVRTTWTLLLYLTSASEGCIGGETVFYPHDRRSAAEEIAVSLETGMLLLHKHGDDCLLHEGREVQAGEKWVLRTDLCIRR
ncbi:hypothetical protein PT974_01131 [Cladobotryum mycophilum]|uniref:Fe2OG dioxygenase domain-containing protein n=1 Tax=Cladobotryum mycophilum TaxID=491253 RepID=A0ABR0T3E0_9HYPO